MKRVTKLLCIGMVTFIGCFMHSMQQDQRVVEYRLRQSLQNELPKYCISQRDRKRKIKRIQDLIELGVKVTGSDVQFAWFNRSISCYEGASERCTTSQEIFSLLKRAYNQEQ